MFKQGDTVRIADIEATKNDDLMDKEALKIIEKSDFTGDITKVEDGIYFVGFSNDLGWVTQGFKENEIQAVE